MEGGGGAAATAPKQEGAPLAARPPLLRLEGIEYTYPGGVQALGGVDLSISSGEIISIVGPSGCGKSTLLSIIARLARPDRGTVSWDAEVVASTGEVGRLFTLMFQRDTLLPWLRVEDNVAFGLRYLKLKREEREERVTRLLQMVHLEDFRRAYPYQLSGGMRRRVALLTGVAPFPKLLLLDEPFSALDEPTRVLIHGEVQRLVKELNVTAILVTHDLNEAISLSDRVYILTRRPARVASERQVSFEYPRNVLEIRETRPYQQLYSSLWHELSVQIREATVSAAGGPGAMRR
jgi:ABC-type nitrate/sulfonate/bicarbonate transport system ATPase subunit